MNKISNKNTYKKKFTLKNKKKLEQYGGTEDIINVLSWNICWSAMTGNTKKESTRELVKRCKETSASDNKCLTNVVSTIDSIDVEEFDFIALQEASNWRDIRAKSKKLKNMGVAHHRIGENGNVELVTFFNNTKKYHLEYIKAGEIMSMDGKPNGRPYHILVLHNIKTRADYIIFINLHNGHSNTKDNLEEQLSKDLNKFIRLYTNGVSDAQSLREEYYPCLQYLNKYSTSINLIVAGDFNDSNESNMNFWEGFQPFKHSNIEHIDKIKELKVKAFKKPPNTCCIVRSDPNYSSYGDYILVSRNLEIKKDNYIPDTIIEPSSDHKPILIKLKQTQTEPEVSLTPLTARTDRSDSFFNDTLKYIFVFDIGNTLVRFGHLYLHDLDDQETIFRRKIIQNMKKVIESNNYLWIITEHEYSVEEFLEHFFKDDADRKVFTDSKNFYFMNPTIMKANYHKAETGFTGNTKLTNTNFQDNQWDNADELGLKPYALYIASQLYVKKTLLPPTEGDSLDPMLDFFDPIIYLFDDNDIHKDNCRILEIIFIKVTDFNNIFYPIPNLLIEFTKILTDIKVIEAEAEPRPAEVIPGEARPAEPRPAEVRQGEVRPDQCIPPILHKLNIPGDGNCLFYSLLYGLIRLNKLHHNFGIFVDFNIFDVSDDVIKEFVSTNVQPFRVAIVTWIQANHTRSNGEAWDTNPITLGIVISYLYINYREYMEIDDTNTIAKYNYALNKYINNMLIDGTWGDEVIIRAFEMMTNINIIIIRNDNGNFIITGNTCNDGIWLYYTELSHYSIIFPVGVNPDYRKIRWVSRANTSREIYTIDYPNYTSIMETEIVRQQITTTLEANSQIIAANPQHPQPIQPIQPIQPREANDDEFDRSEVERAIRESLKTAHSHNLLKQSTQESLFKNLLGPRPQSRERPLMGSPVAIEKKVDSKQFSPVRIKPPKLETAPQAVPQAKPPAPPLKAEPPRATERRVTRSRTRLAQLQQEQQPPPVQPPSEVIQQPPPVQPPSGQQPPGEQSGQQPPASRQPSPRQQSSGVIQQPPGQPPSEVIQQQPPGVIQQPPRQQSSGVIQQPPSPGQQPSGVIQQPPELKQPSEVIQQPSPGQQPPGVIQQPPPPVQPSSGQQSGTEVETGRDRLEQSDTSESTRELEYRKEGSNSGNMFAFPLICMIVAVPIIFIMNKM